MSSDSNKLRLQELMWLKLRTQTQIKLQEKLSELFSPEDYSFLSFEESDRIQLLQEEWPSNKWEDDLYFQTDLSNQNEIERLISSYVHLNESSIAYVFF